MDTKVVSCGDALLRACDVALLRDPHAWLNDAVVAFALERDALELGSGGGKVAFVAPGVAFLAAELGPEAAPAVVDAAALKGATLVLAAVNDNPDAAVAGGGSHWSLLAFRNGAFEHYDSVDGANARAATRLAAALAPALPAAAATPAVAVRPAPQQRNGHDCGVFACAVARALREAHLRGEPADATRLPTAAEAERFRAELFDAVKTLVEREEEQEDAR